MGDSGRSTGTEKSERTDTSGRSNSSIGQSNSAPSLVSACTSAAENSLFANELRNLKQYHQRNELEKAVRVQIASQMSVADLPTLSAMFKKMDSNHDGVLDHEELTHHLILLGVDESTARKTADALDLDHDGRIEYTEFVAGCLSFLEDSITSMLGQAFQAFDMTNSGTLTRQDVKLWAELMGTSPEERDISSMAGIMLRNSMIAESNSGGKTVSGISASSAGSTSKSLAKQGTNGMTVEQTVAPDTSKPGSPELKPESRGSPQKCPPASSSSPPMTQRSLEAKIRKTATTLDALVKIKELSSSLQPRQEQTIGTITELKRRTIAEMMIKQTGNTDEKDENPNQPPSTPKKSATQRAPTMENNTPTTSLKKRGTSTLVEQKKRLSEQVLRQQRSRCLLDLLEELDAEGNAEGELSLESNQSERTKADLSHFQELLLEMDYGGDQVIHFEEFCRFFTRDLF
jgi:Ca2+-binding EF-hand superfamily protein